MKVIRALRDIHVPITPEEDREDYVVFSQIRCGNLALIADSYIKKLDEDSFELYANVNEKFKRDKFTNKKVDNVNMGG
jgi:hypothetical protein